MARLERFLFSSVCEAPSVTLAAHRYKAIQDYDKACEGLDWPEWMKTTSHTHASDPNEAQPSSDPGRGTIPRHHSETSREPFQHPSNQSSERLQEVSPVSRWRTLHLSRTVFITMSDAVKRHIRPVVLAEPPFKDHLQRSQGSKSVPQTHPSSTFQQH